MKLKVVSTFLFETILGSLSINRKMLLKLYKSDVVYFIFGYTSNLEITVKKSPK